MPSIKNYEILFVLVLTHSEGQVLVEENLFIKVNSSQKRDSKEHVDVIWRESVSRYLAFCLVLGTTPTLRTNWQTFLKVENKHKQLFLFVLFVLVSSLTDDSTVFIDHILGELAQSSPQELWWLFCGVSFGFFYQKIFLNQISFLWPLQELLGQHLLILFFNLNVFCGDFYFIELLVESSQQMLVSE